ncbi:hypothetical protein FFLO_02348 [Filobasidium floriforme]|uniref:NUA/TPR/MLP1-2-like domain-containing protein n=1 Tax=Filobasidium floriforme TaxID=5210 RepID=A0A8K0NU55_9TREE|nr:uncharacterized protein HD553DRAFT_115007 [Filobasidium floriforme]KAG7562262.1 hypothetical protein FFLO_02348 [Filobasidium floriforme]KAH8080568.1 hypothetical protein HD553DRAFT_115007 [Filobasidium floriforme]
MAENFTDDSRVADSIIEKVAQEQAYQDLQDRLKNVEEECRKERAEKEKVKAERDELATTNAQLQEANSSTQSTFATISTNVRDYETRIRILEREKEELRQDFSQLKQKSRTDNDLVRKYRETSESDGRQIRQLDVERSEAIYAKNKMEHQQKILSSALETVRKESEMYSKALVDKEAEFASYRSSHYMELQQTLSERDREAQSRLQVEKARDQVNRQYQENLDALNSAQTELTALQNKLSKKSSDFRADAAALQKRIDSLENRSKEDREAVEGLEEAFREAQEAHAQRVEAYEDEIQAAAERQTQAEEKMAEMARTVELLSQGVESSTDDWGGLGGEAAGQMAAMIGSSSGSTSGGKTLKQALAEVVRLQAESGKLKVENERLEGLCRSVLRDLEERKPVLDQQRAEYFRMKTNADDLARQLAETIQAKEAAEAELVEIRSRLNDASVENKTLKSQSADLGLQVRVLTREIAIRDDPALAYEAFDPIGQDHPEISDIDAVITNNLTMFKKLPQLLEQNKKLLRISRELGRKLEEKASSGSSGAEASDNDLDNAAQAIENLTETVNSLRAQVVDSRTQLELSIKERDMYSRLLVQGRMLGMSSEAVDKIASGQLAMGGVQGQDDVVRNVMSGIQAEFEKHRDELQREVKEVQEKVEEKTREVEAERERTASALASLRHEQNQNLALTQKMEQEKSDLTTHLSTIAIREAEILNLRTELARVTNEENHLRAQKKHLQTFVDGLNAQKEMLQANELASAESTSKLLQEKAELSREISSRKLLHDQELLIAHNAKQEAENALTSLREDLEKARNALAEQRTANQTLLTSSKSPELQKRIDELETELATITKERDEKIAKLQEEIAAARADVQTKLNIGLKWQKRTKELMAQINETKETHTKAVTELQTEVTSLKTQIESLNGEVATAKQNVASKSKEADEVKEEVARLKAGLADKETALAQAAVNANTSVTPASEVTPVVDGVMAETQKALDQAKQRIGELESQLSAAITTRDEAVAEQRRLQSAATANVAEGHTQDALRQDLPRSSTRRLFELPMQRQFPLTKRCNGCPNVSKLWKASYRKRKPKYKPSISLHLARMRRWRLPQVLKSLARSRTKG